MSPHPSLNMLSSVLFLLLVSVWFAILWIRRGFLKRYTIPLPPGPKPLPFLGNLLDIPKTNLSPKIAEWGRIYGDLVHVHVLGSHTIYINSLTVAQDLFEKRSRLYSSRILTPMMMDMYVLNPFKCCVLILMLGAW